MAIHAEFAAAYQKVENVKKNARNDHFGNSYASLEVVLENIKPVLGEHNLILVQESVSDENGVGVHTLVRDESGESIDFGTLTLPLSKKDPQGVGSALTYARRYSLKSIFGLAEVDDDGGDASRDLVAEEWEEFSGRLSKAEKSVVAIKLGNPKSKAAALTAWKALSADERAAIVRGIEEGTV